MSDTLHIQIIYSGVEYTIEIQINQCSFDDLIDKVKSTIKSNKPIQLMTVNTQECYQNISKSNYNIIIREDFEDNILIVVVSEENEKIEDNSENANNNEDDENSDLNSNDEELKDDSFSKEVEDEKIIIKSKSLSKEYCNKDNSMNNNELKLFNSLLDDKSNQQCDKNSDHISEVIQQLPDSSSLMVENNMSNIYNNNDDKENRIFEQLNINEEKKELDLNQHLSQVKEKEINFSKDNPNNLLNDLNLKVIKEKPQFNSSSFSKLNSFSTETCSICKGALQYTKFICCICDNNIILCQECESNHPHPSFKYKTHFLSTFQDLFTFIDTLHKIKAPLAITNLFKKEYEVEIQLKEGEITMRPNQTLLIPITILNKTNTDIKIDQMTLLIRNQGKLKITYNESSLVFKQYGTEAIILKCQSEYSIETNVVILELYSNILKLKDTSGKTAILRIEVNEDVEEEKLNEIFEGNDRLKMLKKKKKEMINYIIQNKISNKSAEEIARILIANNWIVEKSITQLT